MQLLESFWTNQLWQVEQNNLIQGWFHIWAARHLHKLFTVCSLSCDRHVVCPERLEDCTKYSAPFSIWPYQGEGSTCTGSPRSLCFCHSSHVCTHTHTIMSFGKQGEEAVTRLCTDLMSFNSLAAGPGAGQSWVEAKTGLDHLWRQKKKAQGYKWKCVGACVCVMCMSFISLSPLIFSISVFLYLHVCARSVRYLAGGSCRGQEQQWAEVRWTNHWQTQ